MEQGWPADFNQTLYLTRFEFWGLSPFLSTVGHVFSATTRSASPFVMECRTRYQMQRPPGGAPTCTCTLDPRESLSLIEFDQPTRNQESYNAALSNRFPIFLPGSVRGLSTSHVRLPIARTL